MSFSLDTAQTQVGVDGASQALPTAFANEVYGAIGPASSTYSQSGPEVNSQPGSQTSSAQLSLDSGAYSPNAQSGAGYNQVVPQFNETGSTPATQADGVQSSPDAGAYSPNVQGRASYNQIAPGFNETGTTPATQAAAAQSSGGNTEGGYGNQYDPASEQPATPVAVAPIYTPQGYYDTGTYGTPPEAVGQQPAPQSAPSGEPPESAPAAGDTAPSAPTGAGTATEGTPQSSSSSGGGTKQTQSTPTEPTAMGPPISLNNNSTESLASGTNFFVGGILAGLGATGRLGVVRTGRATSRMLVFLDGKIPHNTFQTTVKDLAVRATEGWQKYYTPKQALLTENTAQLRALQDKAIGSLSATKQARIAKLREEPGLTTKEQSRLDELSNKAYDLLEGQKAKQLKILRKKAEGDLTDDDRAALNKLLDAGANKLGDTHEKDELAELRERAAIAQGKQTELNDLLSQARGKLSKAEQDQLDTLMARQRVLAQDGNLDGIVNPALYDVRQNKSTVSSAFKVGEDPPFSPAEVATLESPYRQWEYKVVEGAPRLSRYGAPEFIRGAAVVGGSMAGSSLIDHLAGGQNAVHFSYYAFPVTYAALGDKPATLAWLAGEGVLEGIADKVLPASELPALSNATQFGKTNAAFLGLSYITTADADPEVRVPTVAASLVLPVMGRVSTPYAAGESGLGGAATYVYLKYLKDDPEDMPLAALGAITVTAAAFGVSRVLHLFEK